VTDVLTPEAVVIGAAAIDRDAAIDIVGGMLVRDGRVTSGYIEEMRDREKIISTYLGNGIALPHGTNEARTAVLRTGLAVAQFPAGVPWGDDRAFLVVGLAATSEEHVAVLARLAAILEDEQLCAALAKTSDAMEIYRALMARSDGSPPGHGETAASDEVVLALTITNPAGLHARPAAVVVDRARSFRAEVSIETHGRRANARSITALLALGAATGDQIKIIGRGADARAAVNAVAEIVTGPAPG
jgi:multiphosphoryl transfer protein